MLTAIKKQLKKLKVVQEIFKTIEGKMDKFHELYNEFFGVQPNGLLGHIPVFVISTSYTQDNEITGYKSYLKENFNENMFINPYTLEVEVLVYGNKFVQELEKLIEFSKKRDYTAFMYTKLDNKVYAPVALTNLSYSENYENYTNINVKLSLKEVNLLEFVTDENGVTTTNVYVPEGITQNKELTLWEPNDTMSSQLSKDVRTRGYYGNV